MSLSNMFKVPRSIWLQTGVVKLPRLVHPRILSYTTPEGPQPFIISIPSRSKGRAIPLFIFVPPELSSGSEPAKDIPVIIDFHGGGFFMGSCLEQAPFCAKLARDLGAIVITVDYRMGPIDKFPAALEDAEDVLGATLDQNKVGGKELRLGLFLYIEKMVRQKKYLARAEKVPGLHEDTIVNSERVAITGFSSGANLALNLGISLKKEEPHVLEDWPSPFSPEHPTRIPLLLYYPSLDCRELPSMRKRPESMGPAPPKSRFFDFDALWSSYLPRESGAHPRASPGLVSVEKGGLHPQARMLLVLPELDSLSEQSESWVKKVKEEGRSSHLQVKRYPGMKHGWLQFPISWLSEEEKKTRDECYESAVSIIRDIWEGRDLEPSL